MIFFTTRPETRDLTLSHFHTVAFYVHPDSLLSLLSFVAVQDRVDEMVEFELPGRDERLRMLLQYFNMYIEDPSQNNTVKSATAIAFPDIDPSVLELIADKTDGFSGRNISKMAIAWQAAAYAVEGAVLTPVMMDDIVDLFIAQQSQRSVWEAGGQKEY